MEDVRRHWWIDILMYINVLWLPWQALCTFTPTSVGLKTMSVVVPSCTQRLSVFVLASDCWSSASGSFVFVLLLWWSLTSDLMNTFGSWYNPHSSWESDSSAPVIYLPEFSVNYVSQPRSSPKNLPRQWLPGWRHPRPVREIKIVNTCFPFISFSLISIMSLY